MVTTTITSKGQITIPAEIRQIPGYGPGNKVSVYRDVHGHIIIESLDDWISRTRGMLRSYAMNALDLTDDEVDEMVAVAIAEDAMNLGTTQDDDSGR